MTTPAQDSSPDAPGVRVFLSYKRNVEPDEPLARQVMQSLTSRGHSVFIDQKLKIGQNWAAEIEIELRQADFFIVFLSDASSRSEMVQGEIDIAREQEAQGGKPKILPVRVGFTGSLPYPLNGYLDKLQCAFWREESDTDRILADLHRALGGGALSDSEHPLSAGGGELIHGKNGRWWKLFTQRNLSRGSRVALAAVTLGLILAVAVPPVFPAVWHRLAGTTVMVLPITASEPAGDRPPSRDLTGELSRELLDAAGVESVPSDVVTLLAATQALPHSPCVPEDVLVQALRLTDADYVVSGSFDPFQDGQPRRVSLCLQRAWNGRKLAFLRREIVPGMRGPSLADLARSLGRIMGISPRTALLSRRQRLTRSTEAVRQYLQGLLHFQRYELGLSLKSLQNTTDIAPDFYLAHLEISRLWRELGDDGKAKDEARTALTLFDGLHLDAEREQTLLRAYTLVTQGKWNLAQRLYRVLWDRDPSDATAAVRLVETQNAAGRSADALRTIREVRDQQGRGGLHLPLEVDVQLDIEEGIAHHRLADLSQQLESAQRALNKIGVNQDLLKARAWYLACDAHVSLGKWPSKCQEAAQLFEAAEGPDKSGDRINRAKFFQLEARWRLDKPERDEHEAALLIDRKALDIFRETGFVRGISEQLSNLAYSLSHQNPPQEVEAALACRDAVAEARKARSLAMHAILVTCGYYPMIAGQLDEAAAMYQTGLAMAQERGDTSRAAIALGNLAYVRHAQGHTEEALHLYEQSLALSDRLGDQGVDYGETLIRYARLLSDLDRTDAARSSYQRGLCEARDAEPGELADFYAKMKKILKSEPPPWRRLCRSARPCTTPEREKGT
jgi:tetratricopeptide (TPR) repeat protein